MQNEDADDRETDNHETPRWVRWFGIVAIGLILLFVLMLVFVGGRHGPGRHLHSGNVVGHATARSA